MERGDTMHAKRYFEQAAQIANMMDHEAVDRIADGLIELRKRKGRLFFLGVGGSAANCSHAVNDFRKLAGIEAYSPCDNVAELTARTNDEAGRPSSPNGSRPATPTKTTPCS